MNYDIIIPLVKRNIVTFPIVLNNIREFLNTQEIYVIGNRDLAPFLSGYDCFFIDEDQMISSLSYASLREQIERKDIFAGKRTGWYLQQFLKIEYSLICSNEYYLLWDADTIPLRRLEMFDSEQHPYFDVKTEHHLPYFTTMTKLLNAKIDWPGYSFVSEHMIINKNIMIELINTINNNTNLPGKNFHEKVINAINVIDLLESGFSEFETYGNYTINNYRHLYRIRHLSCERNGEKFFEGRFDLNILKQLSNTYDLISIENRNENIISS